MKITFRLIISLLLLGPVISTAAESEPREITPTRMMTAETRLVVSLLEQAHFQGRAVGGVVDELLPGFMSDLDYHRLFFTQADHEKILKEHGPTLETELRRGNLRPPFAIFSLYRERALNRIDWILERLDGEFDFESDDNFVVDRRKMDWPTDTAEADELWDKRLTYELLADLLNDRPIEEALDNVRRRYERLQRSLLEMDAEEVQERFLTSLTKLYDPHSSFLSASTLEDFSISMRLSLVGIGALLRSEDGYSTIQELIPGGPAAIDNQLQPNDRIVAVAQDGEEPVDVIDMKLRRVVDMIRGKKGTPVHLTVIPADAADSSTRRIISLVRDEVRLTASRAQARIYEVPRDDKTIPVGVISIPSFYGMVGQGNGTDTSTTEDVAELIDRLKEKGIQGLVLDLRRNGGGLLTEAIRLTGLFIETGPVVRVKSSDGRLRVDNDENQKVAYSGPLGILVSRNSASASEIVAGALQNYGRALVLGETSTHGKGTVQAIFELENYLLPMGAGVKPGATKLTVQKFYLPDGQSTQNRGVIPDIIYPSFNEYLSIGESDLPNALVWDKITPADWKEALTAFPVRSQLDKDLISRVQSASAKRKEALEEFNYLLENIDWFRAKQEEKAISLNLEKRRSLREQDESFRQSMREREKELADKAYAYNRIFLDDADQREEEETPDIEEIDGNPVTGPADNNERLDIHLRESLRVMTDLVELGRPLWSESAVTAQKSGGNRN